MVFKVKRVAVIGAGVSGVVTAKHLKSSGLEVVVYERSSTIGGIWSYDERQPFEPQYPSVKPSVADFVADAENINGHQEIQNGFHEEIHENGEIELKHAPPGPAYNGLTNNISNALQELKGYPWKEEVEDYANVRVIGEYIQGFAKTFNIEPLIKHNSRVEKLEKVGDKWWVYSMRLIKYGPDLGTKRKESDSFDAVVVASGHYHAPRVPEIPGLKDWKARWPERVQHSKGYRRPDGFKDQNILLIGGGASAMDISREATPFAKKIYQSSRGGSFDLPFSLLPATIEHVPEIASFTHPTHTQSKPGPITMVDGTVLNDIDRVVLCTGYHFSYPFLLDLHEDFTRRENASDTVLVTDGTQVHNLHKDIFYIPEPTLAFVGVPFYTTTFTFFEFQAIVVAAVFSGRAWLPSKQEMTYEYRERLKRKEYGRLFHALKDNQVEHVNELVEWVNSQAEVTGGERLEGHTKSWMEERALTLVKFRKFLALKDAQAQVKIEEDKK